MALPLKPHTNQYKFGRGKLYVDLLDASGAKTGERFLGNCPGFTLSVESESFEHFSSTGGLRTKDLEVVMSVNFAAQIQCDDVTKQNLALFLGGSVASIAQAATPVTGELVTVKQGYEYQLGATAANPPGIRGAVTGVTVKDEAGTTTYTVTTDYLVDADTGRVLIVEGGGIADGSVVQFGYTPAAGTVSRVTSGDSGGLDAAVRFIADNANGENDNCYIPKCSIAPSGELPLITEDELASFTLDLGVGIKDSSTQQIYIDGALVAA